MSLSRLIFSADKADIVGRALPIPLGLHLTKSRWIKKVEWHTPATCNLHVHMQMDLTSQVVDDKTMNNHSVVRSYWETFSLPLKLWSDVVMKLVESTREDFIHSQFLKWFPIPTDVVKCALENMAALRQTKDQGVGCCIIDRCIEIYNPTTFQSLAIFAIPVDDHVVIVNDPKDANAIGSVIAIESEDHTTLETPTQDSDANINIFLMAEPLHTMDAQAGDAFVFRVYLPHFAYPAFRSRMRFCSHHFLALSTAHVKETHANKQRIIQKWLNATLMQVHNALKILDDDPAYKASIELSQAVDLLQFMMRALHETDVQSDLVRRPKTIGIRPIGTVEIVAANTFLKSPIKAEFEQLFSATEKVIALKKDSLLNDPQYTSYCTFLETARQVYFH